MFKKGFANKLAYQDIKDRTKYKRKAEVSTWELHTKADNPEEFVRWHFGKFPEHLQELEGDIRAGESWDQQTGYDEIHVLNFSTEKEAKVPDPDTGMLSLDISPGQHKVTVERRYGKVDVWVDDQIQIMHETDGDEGVVKEYMEWVDSWIHDIA